MNKSMQLTCHADAKKMETMYEEIHGAKQDAFSARVEQYTDKAKQDGQKLVLAMVADPYHLLGEIFQISLSNTECDAGMIIKSRVMRLIEERSLVFLNQQCD